MQNINPEELIVIDIETAPASPSYELLPDEWKELWQEKTIRTIPEGMTAGEFYVHRAGVMAEFSRIVCISIAYFVKETPNTLRLKSFYDSDEKQLLKSFSETLNRINTTMRNWCFAGHNIREFDIPFICRRMIINGLELPNYLNFQNMKPWETKLTDTFQMWRFGDYKNFTSLKLLAAALGVPSPKDDIDGSMVGELFWSGSEEEKEINLKRIVTYCQKDVITTANIILRFCNRQLISPENVQYAD